MSDVTQKFIFSKTGPGTVAAKLGYRYAIEWTRKPVFNEVVPAVENLFGPPVQRYMISRNRITGVHDFRGKHNHELRWLFSTKNWAAVQHTRYTPYWAVFKTEKDRLLASMVI